MERTGWSPKNFFSIPNFSKVKKGRFGLGKKALLLEGGASLKGVKAQRIIKKTDLPEIKKGFWDSRNVTVRTQSGGLAEVRAKAIAKALGISEKEVFTASGFSEYRDVTDFVSHMEEKKHLYEKQFDQFVSSRRKSLKKEGKSLGITKEQLLKITAMDFHVEKRLELEIKHLEKNLDQAIQKFPEETIKSLIQDEAQLMKDFAYSEKNDRQELNKTEKRISSEGTTLESSTLKALENKKNALEVKIKFRKEIRKKAGKKLEVLSKYKDIQEAKKELQQKQEGAESTWFLGPSTIVTIGEDVHRFQQIKKLGKGAQGEAHLLKDHLKACPKAMKVLKNSLEETKEALDTEEIKDIRSERQALRDIKAESEGHFIWRGVQDPPETSVYVVNAKQGSSAALSVGYIGPLYNGDMEHFLSEKRALLDDGVKFQLLDQMLHGLMVCEHAGRVNTDIKPANMFYKESKGEIELKIADFGGVEKASEKGVFKTIGPNFTDHYAPPEGIRGHNFLEGRKKLATWPAAISYLEISSGRLLTNAEIKGLRDGTLKAKDLEPNLNPEIQSVLDGCLEIDPSKRLGGKEAWQLLHKNVQNSTNLQLHPVFEKWEQLYSVDAGSGYTAYQEAGYTR